MIASLLKKWSKDSGSISTGLLYGTINGIMCIPVTISFCTIIYRDKGFETYLPQLVKLVLFSSMIHQWAFTYFSSLPFAIGQVQDAGLIFLSAMASDIVQGCAREEQIVPTTIVVLPICTFLLGGMLVVVAKLKLATVIQYLPMPVIGGYLAFIGFFCGQAGLAMMAGAQVTNISEWGNLYNERAIILLTPGVLLGVTTYMLLRNVRSPYVLPACMAAILALFFSAMLLSGMTLEGAREYGWISPLSVPEPFYESWKLYDFSLVDWTQLPQQLFRLIGMFLVVAFSSSLDVAAIEMEMGLPLDYNRELNTVGIANMFSGLTGGYTGSYIFSQTIFTMRRGVYSRVNGYTVAVCELLLILAPISVISYLPKMFFGSLLVLISTDLMFEWLVAAREKMADMEYLVCLLTFAAIQATGIEVGMFIGILLAMASFVVSYSRLQSVSCASLQTSTVIRTFEERAALIANRGKVVTITLKGYIFFGSAVKILQDVKSHVSIQVPDLSPQQLMQLQQQQQALADKHAVESNGDTSANNNISAMSKNNMLSSGDAYNDVSESTGLLSSQPAAATYGGSGAGNVGNQGDFSRLEGSRMSFRINTSSGSGGKAKRAPSNVTTEKHVPAPPWSTPGSTSSSAAKKLFPDISVPQTVPLHSGVGAGTKPSGAHLYDAQFGALGRSSSMPINAEGAGAFTKPLRGQSFSQALSVYDMSPDTMQRIIEERHRYDDSEQDTFTFSGGAAGNSTAREHSLGCGSTSGSNKESTAAAHTSNKRTASKLSLPLPLPLPAPVAMASEGGLLGAADSHGDLEMGKVTLASSPAAGRSLLTERIQNAPIPVTTSNTSNAAPVSASTGASNLRQPQLRRQSGSAKMDGNTGTTMAGAGTSPVSTAVTAPATVASAAIEIRRSPQADAPKRSVSGDMGSSQASSLSARSYRQNSGMRKVSFDGAVPGAAEGAVADSAAGANAIAEAGPVDAGDVAFSSSPGNTSYIITTAGIAATASNDIITSNNAVPKESLLATVWEHQAQRQHRTNLNNGTSTNGGNGNGAPANIDVLQLLRTPSDSTADAQSPRHGMSQQNSLLAQTSNQRDGSGSIVGIDGNGDNDSEGAGYSLTRERSFKEEYGAKKKRKSAQQQTLATHTQPLALHTPASPPPEMLLHSLAEHQHSHTQNSQDKSAEEGQQEIMTEYLVLDFSAVVGVDATATRSCFLMLVQLMRSANVAVVFANMTHSLEALFRAHKVIGSKDIVIPLLDDALEWCEEQVLISAGHHHLSHNPESDPPNHTAHTTHTNTDASQTMGLISPPRNPSFYQRASKQRQQLAMSKRGSSDDLRNTSADALSKLDCPPSPYVTVLTSNHSDSTALRRILEDYLEVDSSRSPRLQQLLRSELLSRFFRRVCVSAQEVLFDVDQLADKIYFIESGEVEIVTVAPTQLGDGNSAGNSSENVANSGGASAVHHCALNVVRVNKVSAGGAFGEADFLLGINHSVQAHTMAHSVFWTLDREQYSSMEVTEPSLCLLIQHSLLKSLAIASTCAMYAQHPSTAYGNNVSIGGTSSIVR